MLLEGHLVHTLKAIECLLPNPQPYFLMYFSLNDSVPITDPRTQGGVHLGLWFWFQNLCNDEVKQVHWPVGIPTIFLHLPMIQLLCYHPHTIPVSLHHTSFSEGAPQREGGYDKDFVDFGRAARVASEAGVSLVYMQRSCRQPMSQARNHREYPGICPPKISKTYLDFRYSNNLIHFPLENISRWQPCFNPHFCVMVVFSTFIMILIIFDIFDVFDFFMCLTFSIIPMYFPVCQYFNMFSIMFISLRYDHGRRKDFFQGGHPCCNTRIFEACRYSHHWHLCVINQCIVDIPKV